MHQCEAGDITMGTGSVTETLLLVLPLTTTERFNDACSYVWQICTHWPTA
jgi:hypothetical protein